MTNEKAIEWLEDCKTVHNGSLGTALKIAIEAVKRKIPRQVYLEGDGYADGKIVYDYAQCPNCQRAFEETDDSWECGYCPCCGQALNWWENRGGAE